MGLEPNRKYWFRVRAENQYGVSEPLAMDEPITAKVSSDITFCYFRFSTCNFLLIKRVYI